MNMVSSMSQIIPYYPAELLMGHRIHTDIPQPQQNLLPKWSYLQDYTRKHEEFKADQKRNYDRRHQVQPLSILPEDQVVWISTEGRQVPGTVANQADAPGSYLVETPSASSM